MRGFADDPPGCTVCCPSTIDDAGAGHVLSKARALPHHPAPSCQGVVGLVEHGCSSFNLTGFPRCLCAVRPSVSGSVVLIVLLATIAPVVGVVF